MIKEKKRGFHSEPVIKEGGGGEALSDLEIKVGGNIAHFKRTMIYAGDL